METRFLGKQLHGTDRQTTTTKLKQRLSQKKQKGKGLNKNCKRTKPVKCQDLITMLRITDNKNKLLTTDK